MTGVEALCSGVPVIASDLPGLHESLGDGAYRYLHPEDLPGWREAVQELQDPDVWAAASARALHRWDQLEGEQDAALELFCETVEGLCVSV